MLTDIGGIGIYGVISICLFFAVFTAALLLTLRMKKPFAEKMGALPLDDSDASKKGVSHE
ncbi:MAG: cbb3-type cytochrome c oxidase subunit 3 [Verrucomicrobia bacterium]|nr:cbb3-type cytochrome c oxidase subunit 3 [Verrucomicrobiota bacterium]